MANILDMLGQIPEMAQAAEDKAAWQEYLAELEAIGLPEYERMQLEQLGPSALEGVRGDAQSVGAQRAALERLRNLSESGTDAMFDAQMFEGLSRANQNEARTRAGIVDRAASSGGLGGGQALAMQMQAQQEGARNAQRASLDAAAQNQMRAYQALRDSGTLAGQMRGQQYGEDSARARAADEIQRQNLALRQQRTRDNNDLASRGYDDRMRKQTAKSGVYQQRQDAGQRLSSAQRKSMEAGADMLDDMASTFGGGMSPQKKSGGGW